MSPVIGGSARDDAIVILGVTLGFHERLPAPVGARAEIRALRVFAVERVQDNLGLHRRFVDGAIPEVRDLLRMIERPCGIRPAGMVAGVGGCGGVVMGHGVGHLVVANRSRESPLPTPWNLPFQLDAGIQTSNWISESEDGLIMPDTRQNAGRLGIALPPGALNAPAAMGSARETEALPRSSLLNDSQVWAAEAAPASARQLATVGPNSNCGDIGRQHL